LKFGSFAVLVVVLSAGSATADTFLVTVDTSSVNGTPGFLDFQFNPGANSSQLATAQITNFNAGGGILALNPNNSTTGDVTGTLPAPLTFVNDLATNDYFQAFTYGPFFSFVLSLTGPALDGPNGTSTSGSLFGVGLSDQLLNSILTIDTTNGFAGQVLVNLNGTTTPQPIPAFLGGPSVVGFEVVPEPGTMFLLGLGSLGLMVLRRSRA